MAVPLSSTATRLRGTTETPYGLACRRPLRRLKRLLLVRLLPRGAIACEARFASVDKLTELAIITLKEH